MGLLRNASGLIIGAASDGGFDRANDPEFHIRRLKSFGTGMGIDLSSVHPQFSSKALHTYEHANNDGDEELDFTSHDEGLHLPNGHLSAARKVVIDNTAYDQPTRMQALSELDHRSPYQHRIAGSIPEVPDEDFHITGSIDKDVTNPISREASGYLRSSWNTPNHGAGNQYDNTTFHDDYKDAINTLSSRFQEFNRNRQGTSADVSNLVSRSINNPDPDRMSNWRRKAPHALGSQFLGVNHFAYDENDNLHDVIDLKTGTWAKIEPEGYFPD